MLRPVSIQAPTLDDAFTLLLRRLEAHLASWQKKRQTVKFGVNKTRFEADYGLHATHIPVWKDAKKAWDEQAALQTLQAALLRHMPTGAVCSQSRSEQKSPKKKTQTLIMLWCNPQRPKAPPWIRAALSSREEGMALFITITAEFPPA